MEPIWISLLTAVVAALMVSLVSALAARLRFSAKPRLRWVLDILFLLPLVVPGVVTWCTPIFVNSIIWHSPKPYATPAMMAATEVMWALPAFYLCAIMGFRKVSREMIDAARLQGLSSFGIFCHIFLPPAWLWLLAGFAIGLLRGECLALIARACPQV